MSCYSSQAHAQLHKLPEVCNYKVNTVFTQSVSLCRAGKIRGSRKVLPAGLGNIRVKTGTR